METSSNNHDLSGLIERLSRYSTESQLEIVREAYHFALQAHDNQVRMSGEPYIIHPLAVSYRLADFWQDHHVIMAALLHDVVEDTDVSLDTIAKMFSPEVAELVDGVTKIAKYRGKTKEMDRELNQAENIRKMLLATTKDARVLLIKLADRWHNMTTLSFMPEHKQKRIATETIEVFAPLAGRLGIFSIKSELEDLSFRVLEPETYNYIRDQINQKKEERQTHIQRVIGKLKVLLDSKSIIAEITGRAKHFYSIYQKIKRSHKDIRDIYDLRAIRIITDKVTDCYTILGIVHAEWSPIPGRFKDYIAVPKPNLYQSLHTTVMDEDGQALEIQIRTWNMHKVAEEGIAAHWIYKEKKKNKNSDPREYANKLKWLKAIHEDNEEIPTATDFMEHLHQDLFNQEIYVFSPRGEIFHLPLKSTVLDFAFRIHTDIGLHCYGAKIDGKQVGNRYKLESGDQVWINTRKETEPTHSWLKMVHTHLARNRIRNFLRKKEEDAEKSFATTPAIPNKKIIEPVLKTIKQKESTKEEDSELAIDVAGMKDVFLKIAGCCKPISGEPIIGYITKSSGISIHHKDCKQITKKSFEKERLIKVRWQELEQEHEHEIQLEIKVKDTQGILKEIIDCISLTNTNLTEAYAKSHNKIVTAKLSLEIDHSDTLTEIIDSLNLLKNIITIKRIN